MYLWQIKAQFVTKSRGLYCDSSYLPIRELNSPPLYRVIHLSSAHIKCSLNRKSFMYIEAFFSPYYYFTPLLFYYCLLLLTLHSYTYPIFSVFKWILVQISQEKLYQMQLKQNRFLFFITIFAFFFSYLTYR